MPRQFVQRHAAVRVPALSVGPAASQICPPPLRPRPSWQWDWGSAGPESQRLHLLTANDGVVAIFVDSLDGTTFDTLSALADTVLASATFN